MPALVTRFIKVAQSGPCVDGRTIDPQWLHDMAETYDPAVYRAKIWPEHLRWGNNYGTVAALKVGEEDGVTSLYASLAVNAQYLWDNQYDQKLSFSIELLENFAGTGKAYLGGLGVTDSPASLGTDELKFSRRAAKGGQSGARVFAGVPLESASFQNEPETAGETETAEAPGWFTTFCHKFFSREDEPMDKLQYDAMNKRMEGLEGQLNDIKILVEGKFSTTPAAPAASAATAAPDVTTTPATADDKKPQGETPQDFAAKVDAQVEALAARLETALAPLRQQLDVMDKRFSSAKPGAAVPDTTGPADENTPLI